MRILTRVPQTNGEFIEAVMGSPEEGEYRFYGSKKHADSNNGWGAITYSGQQINPGFNNYYCPALTTHPSRSKDHFERLCVVVADDLHIVDTIGMDIDPSYVIQTSANSYQVGYLIIDTPSSRNAALCDKVVSALASKADKSGNNVVRWVRLPYGVNNKAKYPEPFSCKLIEWHPDNVYTVEQVAEAFSVSLVADKAKPISYADIPDTRFEVAKAVAEISSGESIHSNAVSLSAKLVASGVPAPAVKEIVKGVIEGSAADDERKRQRLAGVDSMVDSAIKKGYAPEIKEPTAFTVVDAADFASNTSELDWFIKGVLPKATLGMVYGESGSGKSFVILDMLMAIASGTSWNGHRVKQSKVLYIAAEGATGFAKRLRAYRECKRVAVSNFGVIAAAPNLLDNDHEGLIEAIKAYGDVDLIVIDTLAQTMPGGNENSSEAMGLLVAKMQILSRDTGAMVLPVHHSGKDQDRGARGWSGVKGAMDVELEVTRTGEARQLRVSKMKDGEDGARFSFVLKSVPLGSDSDGDPISSCVVEYVAEDIKLGGTTMKSQLFLWLFEESSRRDVTVDDVAAQWSSYSAAANHKARFKKEIAPHLSEHFVIDQGVIRPLSDPFSTTH